MQKRVYIETTIPSFYLEARQEPEMVARRNWTREWWQVQKQHYELVTSIAVIEELEQGSHPAKTGALELIADLPPLSQPLSQPPEIDEIVECYIARHVMPDDPLGDALHLALASYQSCHFLLTWNCRHLANANKFEHIKICQFGARRFYTNSDHAFRAVGIGGRMNDREKRSSH